MDATTVFLETFGRMPELVRSAVDGLDEDALAWRPDAQANPVGWLVWHLSRVQDDHVAGAAEILGLDAHATQAWHDGFAERFDLGVGDAVGYGMSADEVARVVGAGVTADLLLDYHRAVHERTEAFLRALGPGDWERVVDEDWDPPVTVLVRIASVLGDVTQHVGQAAYVRGLLDRR